MMATTGYDVLSGLKAVPITKPASNVSPQQAAANALAAQVKGLQQTAPATIAANKAATDINNTQADNLQNQTNAINLGTDPISQSVGQAFTSLGVKGYNTTQSNTATNPPLDTSGSQSAYDLLLAEFQKYGLGALVEPLKGMIQSGASGATMALALQNTDAYKTRFSANQSRIAAGLSALSPAAYIGLEDQYQNIMRKYGLPASYYTPDSTGKQPGFDQLLINDVSPVELEDRVTTAQNRVMNANPEVMNTLKQYYPDITNGDMMSYFLDPKNAINAIKNKVTASEIGGAAAAAGLSDSRAQAEQLAAYGITGAQAQQNYGTIAQLAQRGSQLSDIYKQQPYGQDQATAEVFNTAGQTDATNQRKRLTSLEQASFSGSAGVAQNALSRDRAISPMMIGVPGAGSI